MSPKTSLAAIKWAYTLRSLAPVEDLGGLVATNLLDAAVRRLGVAPGMRVLDLGCGSGAALLALARAVGPTGEVVGVDYTRAQLERARTRLQAAGLGNVRLVEGDAATFREAPESFDRILAAYALSVVPRSRQALHGAFEMLRPGGRIVVVDLKRLGAPNKALRPFYEQLVNPLYESIAYQVACAQPSREIVRELRRLFGTVTVEEHLAGAVYLAWADRPSAQRFESPNSAA